MRTAALTFAACFLVAVAARSQGTVPAPFTHATIEQTEQSLVTALESRNPGMQLSAAAVVRELKATMPNRSFSSLVIPLMAVVKDEDAEKDARIVAALALHELHSARGDYAIKSMAKYSTNDRVAYICANLAFQRIAEDHPEVVAKVKNETRLIAATK